MKRTEIRLKLTERGIFFCHPRTGAWQLTGLSPDLKISTGQIADLRALMSEFMFAQKDFYRERAWDLRIAKQREIGAALCRSVFGPTFDIDPQSWLHFVPEPAGGADFVNFISRVPWMLLTSGANARAGFLAQDGGEPVAITVDADPQRRPGLDYDIRMPRAPRLLMVLPEVRGSAGTGARPHGDNIRARIIAEYQKYGDVGDIRSVRTLKEFDDQITNERFNPQIIYFYGHASTQGAGTLFEFEGAGGRGELWDVAAIADMIGKVVNTTGAPPLIWFNACLGAAAADESALQLFAEIASCVIAMRTVVQATHSRELAEEALSAIIVDGHSPHVALRDTLCVIRPDWMAAGHWAASVVACQYTGWTALGREQDSGYAESDDAVGDFPSRLDRWDPLAKIEARIRDGLGVPESAQPVTLFWNGPASQLPDQFEKRVRDLVVEKFPYRRPIVVKVDLQPEVRPSGKEDMSNDFRVAILRGLRRDPAFLPKDVDDNRLVNLLRELSPSKDNILVFLHGPLRITDIPTVEPYVELWRDLADSLSVRSGSPRIVLAFGFVASSIDLKSAGQPAVRLGSVSPADIHQHLMYYHSLYNLPPRKVPDEATRLYETSGGQFRKLVRTLRQKANF